MGSYSYAPKKLDLDLKHQPSPPAKPSIEEPPLLELKELPSHLRAIGWTIVDIIGIPPGICMHKIQLEEDCVPTIEHQRRLNPPMQEVVKKEIIKWLDAGVVYPISDSKWVSPVECVPKKGGMTVVANEKNELIPLRPVTGWRVCMDYRKLNSWTLKDHFPMSFMDQMPDRLAGKGWFYFLDSYSKYNQICIAPEDQEKTTFTCPYEGLVLEDDLMEKDLKVGESSSQTQVDSCLTSGLIRGEESFISCFVSRVSKLQAYKTRPKEFGALEFSAGNGKMSFYIVMVPLVTTASMSREITFAGYDFVRKVRTMKWRLGFLFIALYLKQCTVSLQHYYMGNYQKGDSLSIPISLTKCGIPRIIPATLRKRIRAKCDQGDRLVRIYLSWFGLAKLILVSKKVRKTTFSSIATPHPDIGCVLGVLDEMKTSFKELQPIYLPFLKDIPLELGMS
ncbi:hypothetical protein FXO37_25969 [Capsicum annuum]|nr:hypothetical protein FXO37_25969 [Capsicum annuum]